MKNSITKAAAILLLAAFAIPLYAAGPNQIFLEASCSGIGITGNYSSEFRANFWAGTTYDCQLVTLFDTGLITIAPYARFSLMPVRGLGFTQIDRSNDYYYHGSYGTSMDFSAEFAAASLGLRWYMPLGDFFNFYVGFDAGAIGTPFSNPRGILTFDGNGEKYDVVFSKNGAAVLNTEMGMSFWVTESIGFGIKAGARTASEIVFNSEAQAVEGGMAMNVSGKYYGLSAMYCFASSPKQAKIKVGDWIYDDPDEIILEADVLMDKGDYNEAVNLYDKVLEYRRDAQIYRKLATALYKAGSKEDAVRLFERSLELNPQDRELENWLKNLKKAGR